MHHALHILLVWFLCVCTTALTKVNTPSNSTIPRSATPHIIFDLGGVLIKTDQKEFFWQLGPEKIALYGVCTGKSPLFLKRKLYAIMNSVEQHHTTAVVSFDDEGLPLPSLMHDWLSGKKTNDILLSQLKYAIIQHPEWFANYAEQWLIQQLASILFTPSNFVATRTFDYEGIELVKKCKQKGCKTYILSNWDKGSFALLKTRNSSIFDLFDGIITSGDHGNLKPDPKLYQILLNTYNLNPLDCIMIDDRIENIQTARSLNMHGIHYTDCTQYTNYFDDFKKIEKEIDLWIRYRQKCLYISRQ